MSTASKYIETDKCINCQEEVGATRVNKWIQYEYFNERPREVPTYEYSWVHTATGISKCANSSGMYAAGNKRPNQ